MAQIARPDSDIAVGSWAPFPADPTTLFDKIDEETPNGDTDYIHSDLDEDECEVGVGDNTDPGVGTGHKIRCYAKSPLGGGAKEKLSIALVENGTVRGASNSINVDRTAYGLIEYTLSEAEANSISNYANLRLRFHIVAVNSNEPIRITQAEFECPDAGEEHSGTGSISGNGSVTGSVKKGAIGSALKSAGGTLLAIGLAGMLAIASIAGGGSQIGVGEKSTAGTASISGSGSQIVVGKKIASGTLSVSGGGSIVATGVKAEGEPHSGTASISGNGSLTGTTTKQALGDSPITGGGSIVTTGEAVEHHFGTMSVSGNGALVAGGIKQAAVDVTIGANGILSGAGEKQSLGDSVVTGGGSVIATGEKSEGEAYSGVAVVSGNGVIDAAVIKQALADLAITGNGVLSGAVIKQALADSTIVGGGSLVAVGTMSESHSGVAIISESGLIDGVGIKQAPGSLVIIGGGFIVAAGYGQEVLIEVVKTVFLKSKLTEQVVELKSTIKRSIVLDSEINPDEGE